MDGDQAYEVSEYREYLERPERAEYYGKVSLLALTCVLVEFFAHVEKVDRISSALGLFI